LVAALLHCASVLRIPCRESSTRRHGDTEKNGTNELPFVPTAVTTPTFARISPSGFWDGVNADKMQRLKPDTSAIYIDIERHP
jgi:hypothetical protein